jgi:hypothetical protein
VFRSFNVILTYFNNHSKDSCVQWLRGPVSSTFNVILTYFNNHSKDSCVQWLQDPVSSIFNVILTYRRLRGPYTMNEPPEYDNLLVEMYVGAYTSFNINFLIVH